MKETKTITLTKTAFANILDAVFYPNPDDPGPYGPIGPIIHWALQDLSWSLLNPQPLPPRVLEPNPDPWRITRLTRSFIDRVVIQYQLTEVSNASSLSESGTSAVQSYIRDVVDDWCGTKPPKWPRPWPSKIESAELRPIDLFAAGAQFQKAASLNNPLQSDFSAAADQLFETALRKIEIQES